MKMYFPIVAAKSERFIESLKAKIPTAGSTEMKELFESYTIETIASIGFGIETDCHNKPENPFRTILKSVFEPSIYERIEHFTLLSSERIARLFNLSLNTQETIKFFTEAVKETLEYRQKHKLERDDWFQMILNMVEKENLTFNEMAANCFLFFLAG